MAHHTSSELIKADVDLQIHQTSDTCLICKTQMSVTQNIVKCTPAMMMGQNGLT